ncbi:F-box/LRR-repeat 17 [Gossypium arboreum]|uniref:F-box/LRR-repeat 17 n=1 Tax=Gossypium arboreum TaxID=29729 RepID=A0A0B0MXN1_GOSAR|nr:F-box/LRR-repeat 17 [Gossypium arboreum]
MEEKIPRRRLRDLNIVQNTSNSEEINSEQQTDIGSSNVPETPDEPAEIQIESCGTCKGRGRMLLKKLYELNPVERVKVFRNNLGQPVGLEARLLAGYLGIIARNANMLSVNYESWHQMPDSNKNQALDNIKERFALEVSDTYIKKALGKKWRDHKSTLKKEYFKKDISLEEKLRNVPPGMLRYQWEDVDRERVGTSSRQKQKFTHTAGSKSFACVAEAEELSSGQKVRRLQFFDITHRKKDGSPMTFEAGEIMEKLKDKKTQYEAIASSDSSVNLENIDNRIITEVLGPERYGRVRFQGSGVNPTQYFGSSSQQLMLSGSQAQAEVQRLRDQMSQMQASTVEQIAQLKAEAAAREAEQNRKYNELQLQLQNMIKIFQQSQNPPS